MSPGYFFEYMHINSTEPAAEPVVIPSGLKKSNKQDFSEKNISIPTPHVDTNIDPAVPAREVKPVIFNGIDLNAVITILLHAVSEISEKKFYGISMYIHVVRGSQSKRVMSERLNCCSEYGKLSNAKSDDLQFVIEWLIENEFLRQTRGPYPVLHPTYNGEHYDEIITRQKLLALKQKLEKK